MLWKKSEGVLPIGMYGHTLHLFEAIRTIPTQNMKFGLRFFRPYQRPDVPEEPFHSCIRQPVECTHEEKVADPSLLFSSEVENPRPLKAVWLGTDIPRPLNACLSTSEMGNQGIEQSCLLQFKPLEPFGSIA